MLTVNPGAIMAGFRLLGWLFPAPPLEELTSESFESLRQKYKSRDRWGNFLGLLAFIAVAAIYYLFISWLAQAATRRFADAKFLHHPMELEYILMGLFLSLASTGFFACLALRAFLGAREYSIYMAYGARRANGKSMRERCSCGSSWCCFRRWEFCACCVPPCSRRSRRRPSLTVRSARWGFPGSTFTGTFAIFISPGSITPALRIGIFRGT